MMQRLVIGLAVTLLAALGLAGHAQEKATLTTAIPQASITAYEIGRVTIGRALPGWTPGWELTIVYVDDLGTVYRDSHTDAEAIPLVKALNTANLSTKSLERRALEHLVAEGKIAAATISGTPIKD